MTCFALCTRVLYASRPIVLVALAAGFSLAQQPLVPAPHEPVAPQLPQPTKWHKPSVPRSLAGGLWRTDANYKSALYLRNDVETSPITVTPVLYLSNGTPYVLPDVTLAPGGTSIVDINAALQSQGIAPYATLMGYVEVRYQWPWDALCATSARSRGRPHTLKSTPWR